MAELIGNAGEVELVVHDQTSKHRPVDRRDGFLNEMKAKHPNIKIVHPFSTARATIEVGGNRQGDVQAQSQPEGHFRRQ